PGCCACSCGAAPGVAERDGPLSGADGPLGGLYHGEGGAVPRTPQTAAATGSRGGSVSARQLPDCRIPPRSEEHTSELQSRFDLVCRLLLEKKKKHQRRTTTT